MHLHRFTLGRSVEGRRIEAYATDPRRCEGLILGGVHGDEPKSVYVVRCLLAELERLDVPRRRVRAVTTAPAVTIVPVVNPDGLIRGTRRNARRVDINRNFPTRDWSPSPARRRNYGGPRPLSEPETRALHRCVAECKPAWIVTVHSIDRHRFCNNYDGPARRLALSFARCNGYPVSASIGYPTPGSFGTWTGAERGIAVLTLELPSHRSREQCWRENRTAFLELLNAGDA